MKKKFWIMGVIFACAFVLASCASAPDGSASTPGTAAATVAPMVRVEMRGKSFAPASITIKVGTTVTWWNMDLTGHSVHADDASFASPKIQNGQSFSFTFQKAGSFPYYSDGEGSSQGKGMSGVVKVTQ